MTYKPNNPPAFPLATVDGYACDGMTLRDYFAAAALTGLLASEQTIYAARAEIISCRANQIADAMLKARGE